MSEKYISDSIGQEKANKSHIFITVIEYNMRLRPPSEPGKWEFKTEEIFNLENIYSILYFIPKDNYYLLRSFTPFFVRYWIIFRQIIKLYILDVTFTWWNWVLSTRKFCFIISHRIDSLLICCKKKRDRWEILV